MPTRTSRSRFTRIAYVLNEQSLRQVIGIMLGISDEIEYTTECSDGSSSDYSSLEDFLSYQNPKKRRITSLSVNTSWAMEPHIQVRFKLSPAEPVEYTVRGEEKDVFYLSGKLDEVLSRIRQWYTPVAFFDFMWSILFAFLIGTVATLVMAGMRGGWISRFGRESIGSSLSILTIFLSVLVAALALGIILNYLRNRLFPVGAFAIGGGVVRFGSIIFWRRALGIGVGLALVASAIAWRVIASR